MKRVLDFFEKGTVFPPALLGAAILGVLAITGLIAVPGIVGPQARMELQPEFGVMTPGDTFVVDVHVYTSVPANVFGGEIRFNNDVIAVESISYNTSIANIWAEKPWYSNGDGTLNFAGGTTITSGFLGDGSLLQVTFKAISEGQGVVTIQEPAIFLHDGLGTAAIIAEPIDAIYTVEARKLEKNLIRQSESGTHYHVVTLPPSTDLNDDGKQSITDISIFMLNITGNDSRFDFNLDGEVDIKDLNILLGAK